MGSDHLDKTEPRRPLGAPERLAAIMAQLLPEDAAWLLPRVALQTADETRRQRLDQRDAAIVRAANGSCTTRAAATLESELTRYAATGWRSGREPTEARHIVLHRILVLNEGQSLRWRQLYNVIKGDRGGNLQ